MTSPLAATSMPSPLKIDWTDDEIMLFLGRWRSGDPLPSNIITEVNPFSFDPWNSPDNIWYLCNSKEPISPKGERKIKDTSSGYWKDMGYDTKIVTGTRTVGRKVSWEFFGGAAPSGDKIGWMMFEYKLEKTEFQATDKAQDFNSLYRVFWQNKHMPAFEEPQNPVSLGDADGDYLQSVLLSMLEQEEDIHLLESAYGSQVHGLAKEWSIIGNLCYHFIIIFKNIMGLSAVSDRSLEDSRPNYSAEFQGDCDFSIGDFLELKDLYDPESSSSSSDNSSCVSRSSDGYFDSEALLRDLEDENKQIVEGHHIEHNFNVSSSLRANRVFVQPPHQSSMQNGGAGLVMMDEISASLALRRGPQPGSLSLVPLDWNGGASRPYQDNKEIDSSSQRAGTSQGSVTNRVGRIAKLGKKYFCFAS